MCKTLHFDSLNSIFQSCAHWVNAFNEHCSASLSLSVLTLLPALESSANLDRKVRSSLITRSSMFIYITKHNGPRTLPWGTPDQTGFQADDLLL